MSDGSWIKRWWVPQWYWNRRVYRFKRWEIRLIARWELEL